MSSLPPLTHHEILALVGPFARRGRHVDLAASDRAERRLDFRPIDHAAVPPDAAGEGALPALRESLVLESLGDGGWRLTRTLASDDGLEARLVAEGDDPGTLLERVEAIAPQRQWRERPDATTVLGHRLDGDGELRLQRAVARVGGLQMRVEVTAVSGFPAEIELLRRDGRARAEAADGVTALPADLLAVLGRRWELLTPVRRGWLGSVMLRGEGAARSRDAEAAIAAAVGHLARTLAEPPARFHERHRGARWRVATRGSLPIAVGLALVLTAVIAQRQGVGGQSMLALLANIAPPLLMGLFFLRREMPRIALPRVPRAPPPTAWPSHAA